MLERDKSYYDLSENLARTDRCSSANHDLSRQLCNILLTRQDEEIDRWIKSKDYHHEIFMVFTLDHLELLNLRVLLIVVTVPYSRENYIESYVIKLLKSSEIGLSFSINNSGKIDLLHNVD